MSFLRSLVPALLLAAGACNDPAASSPFRELSLADALETAGAEKKVVFVDFFTTWCEPCKLLDATTWQDPEVKAWLSEAAVAVKIDAEKNADIAKRHEITQYPTLLLLRPDAAEIDRLVGYRPPSEFLSDVKSALAGRDAVTRARDELARSGGRDPNKRMKLARALIDRGLHAEALEHLLWCWDEGEKAMPSFVGVRVSFLLSHITSLGKTYEPALTALRERRDAAAKSAIAGNDKAAVAAATDVRSINHYLAEPKNTFEVFNSIPRTSDKVRAELLEGVIEELLAKQRYPEILEARPDYLSWIEQRLAMFASYAQQQADVMALGTMRTRLMKSCSPFVEALLGAGKVDAGRALAERLLMFDSSLETRQMLAMRARRTGQEKLARELRERR